MEELFLKQSKYFTVLNAANTINGYEMDDGYNDLTKCEPVSRIQFLPVENIFAAIHLGCCFREVILPETLPFVHESKVTIDINTLIPENEKVNNIIDVFEIDKAYLGKIELFTPQNIIKLINAGADVSVGNYNIVRWSFINNFEIFYFLEEYICGRDDNIWNNIIEDLNRRGWL